MLSKTPIQNQQSQSDDKYSAKAIATYALGGYKQIDKKTVELQVQAGTGYLVGEFYLSPGLYRFAPNGQICWINICDENNGWNWVNNPAAGIHQAEPCNPGPGLIRWVEQGQKVMVYSPAPVGTFTWVRLAEPGDGFDY